MALVDINPFLSGTSSNLLKHRLLHFYYLEQLKKVYPTNTIYHKESLKINDILKGSNLAKTKASNNALLLEGELKWNSKTDREAYWISITPKGKEAFLNKKYLDERNKFIREKINFWVMFITQIGLLAIALYSSYQTISETQSLREELKQVRKKQAEIDCNYPKNDCRVPLPPIPK